MINDHVFQKNPFGKDICDAKLDDGGIVRLCGAPKTQHNASQVELPPLPRFHEEHPVTEEKKPETPQEKTFEERMTIVLGVPAVIGDFQYPPKNADLMRAEKRGELARGLTDEIMFLLNQPENMVTLGRVRVLVQARDTILGALAESALFVTLSTDASNVRHIEVTKDTP